jgi:hypothetical protein
MQSNHSTFEFQIKWLVVCNHALTLPNHGALCFTLGVVGKYSRKWCAHLLLKKIWTNGAKVIVEKVSFMSQNELKIIIIIIIFS